MAIMGRADRLTFFAEDAIEQHQEIFFVIDDQY